MLDQHVTTWGWVEWFGLYGVPGTTTVITMVEQLPDGSERPIRIA
ncbi:hypothetical protein ACFYNW_24950 [Streptomyces virginiae]